MVNNFYDRIEMPDPQNEKLPILFLLDTSESMNDPRYQPKNIDKLNQGLQEFKAALEGAEVYIRNAVDIAIITFGPDVKKIQDFTSFSEFTLPLLTPFGPCPLKEAVETGIQVITMKKMEYRSNELLYKRPFIFLISNGLPTDMEAGDPDWIDLNRRIVEDEKENHYTFFACDVTEDSAQALQSLTQGSHYPAVNIRDFDFRTLFLWPFGGLIYHSPSKDFRYEIDDSRKFRYDLF